MPFIPNADRQTVRGWTPVNLPFAPANDDWASADPSTTTSTAQYSTQPPIWCEDHIFANPSLAVGDVMLWLAENYSNVKTTERFNAGHPKEILNISTIGTRIHRALQAKAEAHEITYEHMRALFGQRRKENGVVNKMKKESTIYLKGMKAKSVQLASVEDHVGDDEVLDAGGEDVTPTFKDVVAWKEKAAETEDVTNSNGGADVEMVDAQISVDQDEAIARFRSWDAQRISH